MRLRIATFNLESLDLGKDFDDRAASLRPMLTALEADILCLQEINGQRTHDGGRALTALHRLLDGTAYRTFHSIASVGPGGALRDVHNLVILSRFPFGETRQVHHDFVPAPRCDTPHAGEPLEWDRPILYAAASLPGGRQIHVFNLHLRAPLAAPIAGQKEGPFRWKSASAWAEGYFRAAVKRTGQALEARLAVDAILDREPSALVAVAGDFNAEAGEDAVRLLAASEEDTANGALAGRSLVPAVPRAGSAHTVLHAGRKATLDHILVSRPLLAGFEDATVANAGLRDEVVGYAVMGPVPGSFHAPVVAVFRLS